ncbi:D-alanine--D-alanine ligase family protein [Thalassobacillus pellis]|uniref:D-alanine--D-alanine ligase family protein n=1 Tax=Thalassobacillus pellis TaxID=748008 RepID=UPI0019610295|nr:D-alanine--D-alanine ligase [Thalassobacillus pellis]MBM7552439.1 D-alanine-D-alanine ligase [Thalassobacillus pellis]
MKIAVLYGGTSGEREVSLSTGKGMIEALENNGHDVKGIDFHPARMEEIINLEVDLVVIGLHGRYGEDGRIQGLLDMLDLPYVGSGVLASALAMDKAKSKQIFSLNGISTARSEAYTISRYSSTDEIAKLVTEKFMPPFVVKPNQEGSTLGLTIIKDQGQVKAAIESAFQSDDTVLIEDYVAGREVTVPVIGKQGQEQALPVIEIIPKSEYYDFDSKYKPGGSEHIVPARLSEEVTEELQKQAVLAHQLLGCDIYSRVDFIVTEKNEPVILEVNTLPGMTPTSLFPDSAKEVGWSYEDMIEKFVELTISQNSPKTKS